MRTVLSESSRELEDSAKATQPLHSQLGKTDPVSLRWAESTRALWDRASRMRTQSGLLRQFWGLGLALSVVFRHIHNWWEAVELTPDFEPEGNSIEQNPGIGANALA